MQGPLYDLYNTQPVDAQSLLAYCRMFTENVVLYLPRNTDIQQVLDLGEFWGGRPVEIEQNFYGDKLKAISVYFGRFSNSQNNNNSNDEGRAAATELQY